MLNASRLEVSGTGGRGEDKLPDEPTKLACEPDAPYAHLRDFLECMRTRRAPRASIDHGYQHMVAVMLSKEALRVGRRLRYDRESEQIVED